jgi:predicted chitinase
MNIQELDSYNLADAVKFHNRLNPKLWGRDEHLLPQVREKLLAIAADFQEFLGVPDLDIQDITLSGSNAAYSYTRNSDIDLHLVVKLPADPVYQELFAAKKYQYNNMHNIKIGGADVELYVQPADQPHHSQGIYSVKNNQWVSVPRRRRAEIDDACVRDKVADLDARIHDAVKHGDEQTIAALWQKIKHMRQSGLEQHGEFGCENISFKLLRNSGCIKLLKDALTAAQDRAMSMAEASKPQTRVRYGFAESPDGVDPTTKMFLEEPATESPDGVNPTTAMFLTEDDKESIVREFIDFVVDRLGIVQMPEVVLHSDPDWSRQTKSFGRYTPETHTLEVNLANRHVMDILRTTAHELVHCRQNQEHQLPDEAGRTGSKWENQANAIAGAIMRDYADHNPKMFENASGYIPKNKKEARDPRYSMALTVDIKPGQVGREANKLALNTDSQGKPALLMKTVNLREGRMPQPSQGPGKYRDLNQPLGPESPPKMPDGTIKVDVSDMYDWYKLGQKISDLKSIKPGELGSGPPSTVFAFGSEDLENMYSHELTKLGLKTHDLDEPGEEDIDEELIAESIDDVLFEINMSTGSLRVEAAKTGAIAGMEFEMIVPAGDRDESDDVLEPDYDQDQRCRSIDDAVDFFHDGDYNGRREVRDLRERMQNDYQEWLDEKIGDDWDNQSEEYIAEWVGNNVDESEWNPNDLEDRARNQALEAYAADVNANPDSDYYQAAYEEFREERQNDWDESDWLDAQDLDLMSGVENAYMITWPHWINPNEGTGSVDTKMVADEFSQAVGREVRVSSRYHSGDRPGPRNQFYVVEPDGSLQGDNDGDEGLEFVSPPMPIDELLKDLNAVKSWAGRMGVYTNESTGLHINISVPNYSIDNLDFVKLALLLGDKYVLEQFGRSSNTYTKSALDLVKNNVRTDPASAQQLLEKMKGNLGQLASKAIHSGVTSKYTSINTKDGHIEFRSPGGDWLDENFDKIENTLLRFTVAMSAALNPEAYREEYLKKLYKLLDPQGGESRGPSGRGGKETIRYFADYVAGKIPQAALRSFVKQAQLERKVKRSNQPMWWKVSNPVHSDGSIEVVATNKQEAIDKALGPDGYPSWAMTRQSVVAEPVRPFEGNPAQTQTDQPNIGGPATQTDMENRLGLGSQSADANYEIVDRRTNRPVFLFIANTPAEAARKFEDWVDSAFDWSSPSTSARHYTWRPRGSSQPAAPTLGGRPSNPDGNWLIVDRNRRPVYRFMAADRRDAETVWLQYSREHHGTYELKYDPDREIASTAQQAPAPGSTQDIQQRRAQGEFTGAWQIVDDTGRELHRFSGVGNAQADANRVAVQWLRDNGMGVSMEGRYSVLPVMRVAEDMSRRGFLGTMGAAAAAGAAPGIAAAGTGVKKPDQSQPASGLGLKMPKEFNLLGNHPQNEITLQKMALGSGLKGPELAQFLGQMKHESWNFEKLKEHPKGQNYFERRYGVQYAPKTASKLGNKYPGDGERYHGRGFVQLTGRENYRRAGAALGLDLLNKPGLAENPEIAAKIAMWYWNSRVRPRVKNFADTAAVTKTINPAMRGLEDRDSNFKDYMRLV